MSNYEKNLTEVSQENLKDKKKNEKIALDSLGENRREEENIIKNMQEEICENDSREWGEQEQCRIMSKLAETHRDNKLLQATVIGLNLATITPEVKVMTKIGEINNPAKVEMKMNETTIKKSNTVMEILLAQIKTGKVDRKLLNEQMTGAKVEHSNSDKKEKEVEEKGVSEEELCKVVESVLDNKKYKARLIENLKGDKDATEKYMKKLREQNQRISGPKGHDWYIEEEVKREYNTNQFPEIKKSKEMYARQARKDLLNHIGDDAYLDKLSKEFNGDTDKAREIQKERIELIKNTKVNARASRTSEEIYKIIKRKMRGEFSESVSNEEQQKILDDTMEYYKKYFVQRSLHGFNIDDDGRKIYIFKDNHSGEKFSDTMRHEFLHSATNGDKNISQKAKNILNKSFQPSYGRRKEYKMSKYFSNTSERLVRKQQLDIQLEEYGVKQYGEKFNRKHYDIMMQLYCMRAFSEDVEQFIRTTRPDFKIFEKLFNKMAKNENKLKKQNETNEKVA